MRDQRDTAQQPTETLQAGPSRASLLQKVPTRWRQPAVAFLVFALGVAAGVGAVLEWQEPEPRPAPSRSHVDEHAVELVLFEAVTPRTDRARTERTPLRVDSAVLLSGAVTSTVLRVKTLDPSVGVRAPGLPVTVSPTARLQSVDLAIIVHDCKAARGWTPGDRPFTVTWRDEHGKSHLDRAGDFDRAMARSLVEYVDAVCGKAARED